MTEAKQADRRNVRIVSPVCFWCRIMKPYQNLTGYILHVPTPHCRSWSTGADRVHALWRQWPRIPDESGACAVAGGGRPPCGSRRVPVAVGSYGFLLWWGRARCAMSYPCPCWPVKARRRRLALVLTGRRTINAHARTVYRCKISVTPVLPVQRRGGPPVFWRICARHQRGFVPVKGAQRRRSRRLKTLDGGLGPRW